MTAEELFVPDPNYAGENAAESQESQEGYAECDHCFLIYDIEIFVTFAGGDGCISELEQDHPVNINTVYVPYEDEFDPELNAAEVLNVLREKGVTHLHHANTVTTSRSFLSSGNLLSREAVRRLGLMQTSQYTDGVDQRYEIFNHLFVDTVDIHERAGDANKYGPVLFVFNVDVLAQEYIGSVRVTKRNPSKWRDSDKEADRYFMSIDELRDDLQIGNFDSMIMFQGNNGIAPLDDHLEQVKLDNPRLKWVDTNLSVYETARLYLEAGKAASGLETPINERGHDGGCYCTTTYKYMAARRFNRMFKPDCKE